MKRKKMVLMPKATAIWLVRNTKLTIQQIMDFCCLDVVEMSNIEKQDIQPINPLEINQLTLEDIKECEKDPTRQLMNILDSNIFAVKTKISHISNFHKNKRENIVQFFLKSNKNFCLKKLAKHLNTNVGFLNKIILKLKNETENFTEAISPEKIGVCTEKEINAIFEN